MEKYSDDHFLQWAYERGIKYAAGKSGLFGCPLACLIDLEMSNAWKAGKAAGQKALADEVTSV